MPSHKFVKNVKEMISIVKNDSNGISLYEITADYRPYNEANPVYYVLSTSVKHAKQFFSHIAPWLKIYQCVELREERAVEVLKQHLDGKHIVMVGY